MGKKYIVENTLVLNLLTDELHEINDSYLEDRDFYPTTAPKLPGRILLWWASWADHWPLRDI